MEAVSCEVSFCTNGAALWLGTKLDGMHVWMCDHHKRERDQWGDKVEWRMLPADPKRAAGAIGFARIMNDLDGDAGWSDARGDAHAIAEAMLAEMLADDERPRVLITVEGGVVQDVTADRPADVWLLDLDIREEAPMAMWEPEANGTPTAFQEAMQAAQASNDEVLSALREWSETQPAGTVA